MINWEDLQPMHLSALQEIGNIGAGNAANALAQMLNQKIEMSVPQSGVLPLQDMLSLIGGEEDIVSCVNFQVTGDVEGNIFFLLTQESAYRLVGMLLNLDVKSQDNRSIVESTLKEIGNILTGSFLTAFNQFTGLGMSPSVPALAFDMLGAVLSGALLESGHWGEKALIIETNFYVSGGALSGHFFLVPTRESLAKILKALGLEM